MSNLELEVQRQVQLEFQRRQGQQDQRQEPRDLTIEDVDEIFKVFLQRSNFMIFNNGDNIWKYLVKGYHPSSPNTLQNTPIFKWLHPYIVRTHQTINSFKINNDFYEYSSQNCLPLEELGVKISTIKNLYAKLLKEPELRLYAYYNQCNSRVIQSFCPKKNRTSLARIKNYIRRPDRRLNRERQPSVFRHPTTFGS